MLRHEQTTRYFSLFSKVDYAHARGNTMHVNAYMCTWKLQLIGCWCTAHLYCNDKKWLPPPGLITNTHFSKSQLAPSTCQMSCKHRKHNLIVCAAPFVQVYDVSWPHPYMRSSKRRKHRSKRTLKQGNMCTWSVVCPHKLMTCVTCRGNLTDESLSVMTLTTAVSTIVSPMYVEWAME